MTKGMPIKKRIFLFTVTFLLCHFATAGFIHAGHLVISWQQADPAPEGYRIYHRMEGQTYDYTQPIWTGSDESADIKNLETEVTHYFVVRAFIDNLESEDSDEVNAIIADAKDSDNDGITDNDETDIYGTDPYNPDTDDDGIQDGTEIGLTLADIGPETDIEWFVPDEDPTTTTSPTNWDTDGDFISDGDEDLNFNGRADEGESDPTMISSVSFPMILRQLLLDNDS